MTPPPNSADFPGPWPDILAAYADGELDAAAHAAVERWLDANPAARAVVRAQQEVSPENWRLWREAEPPRPCPDTWAGIRDGIAAQLALTRLAEPATIRSPWTRRAAWSLTATACGLALVVASLVAVGVRFSPQAPQELLVRSARVPADDPLAGLTVLRIVPEGEVDVWRVADAGAGGWLPVGGMPLVGPLALATPDDVDLEEAEEHPAWPAGFPQVKPHPADMPVLFPVRTR
jgi:hypothetical protein